ncbi:MAG: hypothetical protein K2Y39_15070 [Candidatus Obscuribacterales bacterium]|nr:hypothetical protein [Candidatus Obscuribacterales bacterium]
MTKVINTPNPVPSSETSQDAPCEEALKTLFSSDEVEGNNGMPEDSEEIVVIDGAKNLVSEETGALPAQSPITALAKLSDTETISKAELVNVLESLVGAIRGDLVPTSNNMDFSVTAQGPEKISAVSVDDKTAVIEELRGLLLEAQETIIRLLNDRVDDRANLARLETELKLLPDLQNQADRAIAVAINTDDFRSDLTKVKFELERLRLAKVREEVGNKKGFWTGVRGWFFNKGT